MRCENEGDFLARPLTIHYFLHCYLVLADGGVAVRSKQQPTSYSNHGAFASTNSRLRGDTARSLFEFSLQ